MARQKNNIDNIVNDARARYRETLRQIRKSMKMNNESLMFYTDYFSVLHGWLEEEKRRVHGLGKEAENEIMREADWLADRIDMVLPAYPPQADKFVELADNILLFKAPYRLDAYMQYLEIKRQPQEKFYLPRRAQLRDVVDELQAVADGETDEMFLSMPPRVGKTTLVMFYLTWLMGKYPEKSNLYCSYSDTITSSFYNGILEVISDNVTYAWADIFPACKIANTNAKEEIININRAKRYPTLTCRSLYGTLNGACDCGGLLIADDLISGIEEAMNPDRLISAWAKTDTNLLTRAKENAKIVWVGTRWSLADPIGRRSDLLLNDKTFDRRRVKFISRPALDPLTDESNFDYKYNVGYNTAAFRERRASFERNNDTASWAAVYMQEPIERSGALFLPQDMRFYNGVLPPGRPDKIYMACDVAFGGGDFLSAPIFYQYGEDNYVVDVIFDNGDKKVTQPRLVEAILKHHVATARFEANNGGEGYKDDIDRLLREKNYRLNITSSPANTHKRKQERIFERAPEIREFYFIEEGRRTKDYSIFMQQLFSFKIMGKNEHDDAPDSLAMVCEMRDTHMGKIEFLPRPF